MTELIAKCFITLYPICPSFFRIMGQESGLVLSAVFCFLYIVFRIRAGGKIYFNKQITLLLLVLVGVMCLPYVYHKEINKVLRYVIEYFFVPFLLIDYFRSEDRISFALKRLVQVGCVLSIIGITELVSRQSIFWPLFNGTATDMSPALQIRGNFARAETVFGHAITFGIYLGFCALIASYYAIYTKHKRYIIQYAICVIGLICTISRGPILFYLFAQLLMIYYMGFRKLLKVLLKVVSVCCVTILLVSALFPEIFNSIRTVWLLVSSFFSENAAQATLNMTGSNTDPFWYRLGLFTVIPQYIKGNILFGKGTDLSFSFVFEGHRYYSIDNHYLGTLLNSGLVGLAAVLFPLIVNIAICTKNKRHKRDTLHKLFFCITIMYGVNLFSVASMSEYRIWILLTTLLWSYNIMSKNNFREGKIR